MKKNAQTALIHAPRRAPQYIQTVQPPLFRASTIIFENTDALFNRHWTDAYDYSYGTHGTPTTFTLGDHIAQIEGGLQVEPELGGGVQADGQAQRHVGGNTAPFTQDVVDGWRGNAQRPGQSCGAEAHLLLEVLPQDFTRMDWTHTVLEHDAPQW